MESISVAAANHGLAHTHTFTRTYANHDDDIHIHRWMDDGFFLLSLFLAARPAGLEVTLEPSNAMQLLAFATFHWSDERVHLARGVGYR